MPLSKSDFKVAQTCATKLYYRKQRYPTTLEDNEYLQFLADGGYMVETLARLELPGGREMPFQAAFQAARASAEAFAGEHAVLFEPTFIAGQLTARIDILERCGNKARIIEVKAKSIDTTEDLETVFCTKSGIRPKWRPYLEDIAFQTLVMRRLYPGIAFTPILCMPDKSKTTSIDLLHRHFRFEEEPDDQELRLRRPVVSFVGDVEAARADSFLAFVDVSKWVDRLLPEVELEADYFAGELACGTVKAPPDIGTKCKACEFRVEGRTPSGFDECWGRMAHVSPHILDYFKVAMVGGRGAPVVQALLARGKAGLADVGEEWLTKKDGKVGAIAERQRLQRHHTLANTEYKSPELAGLLSGHNYPLHFIDFEASRIAIPYHAGMHPYDQVCFQWSCHTIRGPGWAVEHAEWINVDDVYPNIEFARSLSQHVGSRGTVYIWSKFELTALKEVRAQLGDYRLGDDDLRAWLDLVINGNDSGEFAVVDMIDIARLHYFHPKMKGRLSIKAVLPAAWESNAELWRHPAFSEYFRAGEDGVPVSPYETLQNLRFGDTKGDDEGEESEAVREGTAAVRAYQELLYGLSAGRPERKEAWRQALLQYCKLDTAAMVIIWMHWAQR